MFSAVKEEKYLVKYRKAMKKKSEELTPDHRKMLLKKRSSVGAFSFFFPSLPNACYVPCTNTAFFVLWGIFRRN